MRQNLLFDVRICSEKWSLFYTCAALFGIHESICIKLLRAEREKVSRAKATFWPLMDGGIVLTTHTHTHTSLSFLPQVRRAMRNAFNLLLVTLAAFDSWYLFGAVLESCRKSFDLASDAHIIMFPHFLYPAHQVHLAMYSKEEYLGMQLRFLMGEIDVCLVVARQRNLALGSWSG